MFTSKIGSYEGMVMNIYGLIIIFMLWNILPIRPEAICTEPVNGKMNLINMMTMITEKLMLLS